MKRQHSKNILENYRILMSNEVTGLVESFPPLKKGGIVKEN
jgi:hypothetical protein